MLGGHDVKLVTPEAVVLQFETAGLGSRLLAYVIDGVIQFGIIVLVIIGFAATDPSSTAGLVGFLVVVLLARLGYHPLWETLNRGRGPGKMAMGLRVVTREGGAIRFRHALIRGLLGIVDFDITYGFAAVISVLATKNNQRLGDLVAGTLVVRERSGAGRVVAPMSFAPPRGFETFTAHLDVSRMQSPDYEAVRSYVARRAALRHEVRADVARSLARPLAARLGHTPPAGMDADVYLMCLAAAYQSRSQPMARPAPEDRPFDQDFAPPS